MIYHLWKVWKGKEISEFKKIFCRDQRRNVAIGEVMPQPRSL